MSDQPSALTVSRPQHAWDLNPVFSPASIAMVGASDNAMSIGGQVYANLKRDFPGRLYPVNPGRELVQGDQAYKDVADLPEPVDLVIVMVAASLVPDTLRRAVAAGHRSAYVLSSGFSESGAEGTALQEQLTQLSVEQGFPVVGPNCIGFLNSYGKVMANFSLAPTADRPPPGSVALISQSGGFGSYILNRAVRGGLGVGYFASTGNEAAVTVSHVLQHVVEQPEIRVIAMFAEAIRYPDLFLAGAERARELDKVIISVTPGASEAVARAVMSHTASIVGSREVYDAVCAQHGVLRVESIDELVDYASILQAGKRMRGRRIGVITTSGGAGVLISGAAGDYGLEVPELPAQRQREISAMLPAFASSTNPVDTTAGIGAMAPDTYERIARALLEEETIDAVIPLAWHSVGRDADVLVELEAEFDKPIAPVVTIDADTLAHRMPAFADPTRAVRALTAVVSVSERPSRRQIELRADAQRAQRARDLLVPATPHGFALESTAKDVLRLYGMPTAEERVVHGPDEAAAAAVDLGGRVVLKVLSYALPHKSDQGGVVLDLDSESVAPACAELLRDMSERGVEVEAVLVQRMVKGSIELAVGMYNDPVFGPVVTAGLGGRLIELTADAVLLPAPFSHDEAFAAALRIAGGRITHPRRGVSEAALHELAAAMTAVGHVAVEHPTIESIDVNPLIPTGDGLVAVDALLSWATPA